MSTSAASTSSKTLSNRPLVSILDASILKQKSQVSLGAFGHLFCAALESAESSSKGDYALWKARMVGMGKHVGVRSLELYSFRESQKREITAVGVLNFITKILWKNLFGKPADQLLLGNDGYLIFEDNPVTNRFVSPPKNSNVNVAVFIGGIIEGALEASCFPAEVNVQFHQNGSTVFIVKFKDEKLKSL